MESTQRLTNLLNLQNSSSIEVFRHVRNENEEEIRCHASEKKRRERAHRYKSTIGPGRKNRFETGVVGLNDVHGKAFILRLKRRKGCSIE